MKFKQHKVEDIKPLKRNRHLKLKGTAILFTLLFLFTFFGLFVYLAKEYRETHTFAFQSPIVLRQPLHIKRVEIISPMASKSAMLNMAYAAEVKNPYDERSPKGIGWELVKAKWGPEEWGSFEELIMRESGWNPYSINQSSGACGLGQSLPCNKMKADLWDYEAQLNWIVSYISQRYGTPAKALQYHEAQGWY